MQKKRYILSACLALLIATPTFAAKKKTEANSTNQPAQTVKLSPEDQRIFDYYFYDAMKAKSLGDYASAYDFLQYCMLKDSTNANVNYELGNFYSSFENKSKALDYYRKAVEYDSDNFYYNMALGTTSLELQQYSDAIPIYERLVKQDPERFELNLYLSEAYRLDGDLPKAIEALNVVERTVGLNEKISLQKFQLYSVLNDKKKAYAEVQKYIDKYPEETKYYILLANLYMQDNKQNEALDLYNKAKSIDPDSPFLITSMANYYELTGNAAAAEKELNDALFNSKIDIDMKVDILEQYLNKMIKAKQDMNTAIPLLDSLIVQHPQESRLNFMYGEVLMLLDKKDDARFQFQVFAESNPTNPSGWEQMLRTAFPDSLSIAAKICEDAISYIPESPVFYLYLSSTYHIKNDYKKALEVLKKGKEESDQSNTYLESELYGRMGDLYHELNQNDSAFVYYEKALVLNPENLGVLNNYSYYLSMKREDLDRAEKMSSITVKAEPTNPTYLDTYGWILFEQGAYTMAKIYLENALKYEQESKKNKKEGEEGVSSVILEHFGDVLYMTDEKEKALEYWIKAKEAGSESKTIEKKIKTKTYIPE